MDPINFAYDTGDIPTVLPRHIENIILTTDDSWYIGDIRFNITHPGKKLREYEKADWYWLRRGNLTIRLVLDHEREYFYIVKSWIKTDNGQNIYLTYDDFCNLFDGGGDFIGFRNPTKSARKVA